MTCAEIQAELDRLRVEIDALDDRVARLSPSADYVIASSDRRPRRTRPGGLKLGR